MAKSEIFKKPLNYKVLYNIKSVKLEDKNNLFNALLTG